MLLQEMDRPALCLGHKLIGFKDGLPTFRDDDIFLVATLISHAVTLFVSMINHALHIFRPQRVENVPEVLATTHSILGVSIRKVLQQLRIFEDEFVALFDR